MDLTNEERLKVISDGYLETICPYIIQYETFANSFPIEILNEIRAVFTHLTKFYASNNDELKNNALKKAEGHLQRGIRDCYKYNCIALEDKYIEFTKMYEDIDLSLVDNGKFLPNLLSKHTEANRKLKEARELEVTNEIKKIDLTDEIKKKYEEAYVAYDDVYVLIQGIKDFAESLKMKALKKKRKEKIYEILTWVFGVVSVVGLVLTIIGFNT